MGSPFDAALAAADHVIGATFGEPIRIVPQRSGTSGRQAEMRAAAADPSRLVATVTGIFTQTRTDEAGRLRGARRGTEMLGMTTMALAPTRVWFSSDVLASLRDPIQAGDRVELVDRPGVPAFTVVQFEPSDVADVTYPLVAV